MLLDDAWAKALLNWPIAAAMALGSYAAGSTPMGGGSVGFPILVLLFGQSAELGRDFSFAIQAIGMTSASIFILARRQPLAWAMLKGAFCGASLALPLGLFLVAPWVPALWIKLIFAVTWGSFGLLHLWRLGEIAANQGMSDFDERWDWRVGFWVGLLAGCFVVPISGIGIDMILYTVLVLVARADLKIAIPTSVVIMAYCSVLGIVIKLLFTGVEENVYDSWLVAAPVVALGAPLGVFVVEFIGRKKTLLVVALLCVAQLVWTLLQERVTLGPVGMSVALASVGGCLLIFEHLRKLGQKLADKVAPEVIWPHRPD